MTATLPNRLPRTAARRTVLDGAGVPLSALLALPDDVPPRATVVALHGAGMSGGYFDGSAHPDASLLGLGARLGYAVLAVDRPGYGDSAPVLPRGCDRQEQSALLRAALAEFAATHETGAGMFLLGHSYGGMLALTAAADGLASGGTASGVPLLGVDVSGCGRRLAVDPVPPEGSLRRTARHWGPLRCYPPDTFRSSQTLVGPVPERERGDAGAWADLFPGVAARVRVPVRLTFAAHEAWWRQDDAELAQLASAFTDAPRVLVERQPQAGHNISLGWAARAYHLRALAFAEDCLRPADPPSSSRRTGPADPPSPTQRTGRDMP
ncbi:alpha/beta hydrolase [Streptomyces exfoliatus]|uniref:alpha/beta hydrolase n=1 Tax=Streptomyces exfoliatus TaxID=1905 RepID=UPI0007C5B7E3|nr:alpha/beta fold hydrolase [Streptomyces exfoliatus]